MNPGDLIQLTIDGPAAGGRMIARLDGRVVLVSGAIPGERVAARVERIAKGVGFAAVERVEEPSPDRRESPGDPLCGGCLYAHISCARQRQIKAKVVEDAFARIGRLSLPDVSVAASPESGYRMRARLHLRSGRIGFFREGTHEVCEARGTAQLLGESCDAIDQLASGLRSLGLANEGEVELSENIDASQRVIRIDRPFDVRVLRPLADIVGLTGLTSRSAVVSGEAYVSDRLATPAGDVTLRRHVDSFFQANRYLLKDLAAHVAGHVGPAETVLELYAGVGLFALSAAAMCGAHVTAVEGDRASAEDLEWNAGRMGGIVTVLHCPVEAFLAGQPKTPDVVIVDPPRTGMSREALEGVVRLRGRRVVYVSCDVATLARDSRRLVDAGYAISAVKAFDLFPNTPHVETVVVFAATG